MRAIGVAGIAYEVDWKLYEGFVVNLVRKFWPKQRSVIGQTVHAQQGAKTITGGDLYFAARQQ